MCFQISGFPDFPPFSCDSQIQSIIMDSQNQQASNILATINKLYNENERENALKGNYPLFIDMMEIWKGK